MKKCDVAKLRIYLAMVVTGLVCLWSGVGDGQEREKLKSVRKEINDKQQEIRRIKIQKKSVLDELDKLDKTIAYHQQRMSEVRVEIEKIQAQRDAQQQEIDNLRVWIGQQERTVNARLVVLYKMTRFGLLPMVFSTDPFPVRLRNMHFLKTVVQHDMEQLRMFHAKLDEVVKMERSLAANIEEEKALDKKLSKRLEALAQERQKKAQLLFTIENERVLYERLLSELEASSKELERLIFQKDKEKSKPERPEILSVPTTGSFRRNKGLLPWPVDGQVIRGFGKQRDSRYDSTIINEGIDIKAKPEQEIRTVFNGSVVYAGWFKGYGQLIIIDHGEGFYSVVAQAGRLTKSTGDKVKTGEVLGYAGDSGALMDSAVHFEIRHKGEPLDPLVWLQRK